MCFGRETAFYIRGHVVVTDSLGGPSGRSESSVWAVEVAFHCGRRRWGHLFLFRIVVC